MAKIVISGIMEVKTGLHIGTGGEYAAIGAADSPVVRDVISGKPYLPGSSLKGKMRSLLQKEYAKEGKSFFGNPEEDCESILKLFGGKKQGRLLFSDTFVANEEDLNKMGIYNMTEIKFENTIDRKIGSATPRQIERVIRGSQFNVEIVYNVDELGEIIGDFNIISKGFKLLETDYIGGSGSRGYGRVKFDKLCAKCVTGNIDKGILEACNNKLKEV